MRISLVTVFVEDQEKAKQFYTNKLGMKVKDDASYGPDMRWLTVVSPEDKDGLELFLALDTSYPGAKDFRNKMHAGKKAILGIQTNNIDADYQALKAKGVVFEIEPTKQEYGGTDALIDDGCGNYINLHQE
jgi:catechol 2,3-dioxygenase-like lactoylglutathione lyase family enzyme